MEHGVMVLDEISVYIGATKLQESEIHRKFHKIICRTNRHFCLRSPLTSGYYTEDNSMPRHRHNTLPDERSQPSPDVILHHRPGSPVNTWSVCDSKSNFYFKLILLTI